MAYENGFSEVCLIYIADLLKMVAFISDNGDVMSDQTLARKMLGSDVFMHVG